MKTFPRDREKEIERIKQIRIRIMDEYPDLNLSLFANELGYTLEAYEKIEKRGANCNYLLAIHLRFKISAHYILTGEPPIFYSSY
jgi:hypothetical protein